MSQVSRTELTPLSFLTRSEAVWGEQVAVSEGDRLWTYKEHAARVRRLAGALRGELDVGPGDRVALLLPNYAAALELHYAVPWVGAILVPMNTRLGPAEYGYMLEHSGAKVVFCAAELASRLPADAGGPLRVVTVDGSRECEYEQLVAGGEEREPVGLVDEATPISINYTSGTTGAPKGVLATHRGSYLQALAMLSEADLRGGSSYLWTLPMFHCNGWTFTWAVTAAGAAHVCLAKVDADEIWRTLESEAVPVSHLCGAPTVVQMIVEAAAGRRCEQEVRMLVGGAPPSPSLLERAAGLNVRLTHAYGLTETHGPVAICAWKPGWDDRPASERARLEARQGVNNVVSDGLRVIDGDLRDVPADGETMGEVVVRGNTVMQGYYRDEAATEQAFRGGWFHSGDLAVMHEDGYLELRDRLKDIVVTGGENVASIEVEQALMAHPAVSEVAVIGTPDVKWGELVTACVVLRPGRLANPQDLELFARRHLAGFKLPRRIEVLDSLPKTGTGKVQKFVLRERLSGGGAGG